MKAVAVSEWAVLDSLGDGVIVLDLNGCIAGLNRAATEMVGQTRDAVRGQPLSAVWPALGQVSLTAALHSGSHEVEVEDEWGRRVYEAIFSPLPEAWPEDGLTVVVRDITERKRWEAELQVECVRAQALAARDSLTGLLNHRTAFDLIESKLKEARRAGREISVVLVDMDRLKSLNDQYGHGAGDAALRRVATALAGQVTHSDIVGRYGGDEFVVGLVNAHATSAIGFIERVKLRLAVEPFVTEEGMEVPITVSCGLATFPANGNDLAELLEFADLHLYADKARGREGAEDQGNRPGLEGQRSSLLSTMFRLISVIDRKDGYTRKHSEQVAGCAVALAKAMGSPVPVQRALCVAGLLHDIGKLGVPDGLLSQRGALAKDQIVAIKRNALLAELILADTPGLSRVMEAISTYHERLDGLGYPRGLSGSQVPLSGRILAVAETYAALTSERPYRPALRSAEARQELMRVAGTQLDPAVVRLFLSLPAESLVLDPNWADLPLGEWASLPDDDRLDLRLAK
jgi:diguanylate cyclase (GGDEF)-like protein/PAS domain S-box-containing protein